MIKYHYIYHDNNDAIVHIPEGMRTVEDFYLDQRPLDVIARTLTGEEEFKEFFRFMRRGCFCFELSGPVYPARASAMLQMAKHAELHFTWGYEDCDNGTL